jgi:arylsulfatase A-like enzyme
MRSLLLALLGFCWLTPLSAAGAERSPNVILIFADDMGYADPACYGSKENVTPNLDRLAKEGVRFTDFYVSSAVCSASRAALLTGCYHERLGVRGAFGPKSKAGLAPQEMTIAEMLASKGYVTGMAGKWHLGDTPNLLPLAQGFGEYYGVPYSHDMWPFHPENPKSYPPLPLFEGTSVINPEVNQEQIRSFTKDFTGRAISFIRKNKDKPFFFYLAQVMPHVPLAVSADFQGKTGKGLYADMMAEVDHGVGQILSTLAECGIDEQTLVMFTSDNGPWLSYGNHGGSALPLREGKGTSFDGGVRVPFLARWPKKVAAGTVCREPAATIDILPTLAEIAGAALPKAKIDGKSIWKLLSGDKSAKSPHEALFFYYAGGELQSMRSGKWKLYFPHRSRTMTGQKPGKDGIPGKYTALEVGNELYDLDADISEAKNLYTENADEVAKLNLLAETMRKELGDGLRKQKGAEIRPLGPADAK